VAELVVPYKLASERRLAQGEALRSMEVQHLETVGLRCASAPGKKGPEYGYRCRNS
jgi:hypothetical protein